MKQLALALVLSIPASWACAAAEGAGVIDDFRKAMERVNAQELAERTDYYAYLKGKGDAEPTLEQHLERFGDFARFGKPADDATIAALRTLSQPALPDALVAFYRKLGGFVGGGKLRSMAVHAPATLVAKSKRDPERPYDHVKSLGLVDMIRWSWGGDRFEFDPKSREGLSQGEVDALNRNYSIVGWYVIDEGEGFMYLYFDRAGRFGTLHYHQDAFDELYQGDLKPMLEGRAAPDAFETALARLLAGAQEADFE